MASTITDRISAVVDGVAVTHGFGIVSAINVTGTNDIVAESDPQISGYIENAIFLLRPANNNTGAVRANIGSGGLVSVKKPNGDELSSGEFSTSLEYLLKFNGTDFRIISPSF